MSAASLYFHPMDARAQQRALGLCVAASLLLHAALLFLLPGVREGGRSAPTVQILTASLGPRSAVSPPVPSKEVPPPVPKPEPQRPQQARPEAPRPVLTAPTNTPSAPVVAAPPPVAVPTPPVAATPPPPAAPRAETPPPAPTATAPTAPGPAVDAVDTGSLDAYRINVIQAASAPGVKRYPAVAMEKGWQGKVEIRLTVAASGITRASSIKTSSGYPVLDEAAKAMVTTGRNRVAIPPALRGKEFVLDVPVVFDLKNG